MPTDSRARYQVPSGQQASHFELAAISPDDKPYAIGNKAKNQAALQDIAQEINTLQDLLYADQHHRMLIVLQGMDTSGKDGTVRAVFSATGPQGVRVVSWKAPSTLERAHDFLWRIHAQVPRSGEITLFNRSHYEDVLVPVVHGELNHEALQQRYAHINDFERLLTESGTTILKFMLHIDKNEQRERLQARIDDPLKNWKFDAADLQARAQWDAYQSAYEQLLRATSTEWAPWTVVPANSKTHRNLMIATLVRDRLASLGLRPPPALPEIAGLVID